MDQEDLNDVQAASPPEDQGPESSDPQTLDTTTLPAPPDILDVVSFSLPQASPAHIILAVLFDLIFWVLDLGFAVLGRVFEPGTSLAIGRRFKELDYRGREPRTEPSTQPQQEIVHLVCCRTTRQIPGQLSE